MAGVVLGKRRRGNSDVADVPARSTRAKQRASTSNNDCTSSAATTPRPTPSSAARTKQALLTASKRISKQLHTSAPSASKRLKSTKNVVDIWQDDQSQSTPQTPRHRDALATTVAVTPRHRLITTSTNKTPRTPRTQTRASTAVYNQAREVFSRSLNPGPLIDRDNERSEVTTFIEERLNAKCGGCLYVSGPPGTGKSALISEVQEQFDVTSLVTASINCMSIRNAGDLTTTLASDLKLTTKLTKDGLRSIFVPEGKKPDTTQYLLVLDEIDHLVELSLDLLYDIFEWSMTPGSRLLLIGIANALDLTDRCLPKLRSRGLKPVLLPFMPYTAAQIASVLTNRLNTLGEAQEAGHPPFLHPAAIQFCAKKVAAQTGDLRKAFDICRRAIDLIERETIEKDMKFESPRKMPLMENINLSSPLTPKSPMKSPEKQISTTPVYTVASAPKATIAHVAKITAQVFSTGANQRLAALNLQQKVVLCSLAALERSRRASQLDRTMYDTPSKSDRSAPTIKRLYDSYTLLCKQSEMLHPLSALDFRDVVSGLETQSLLANADGRGGSFVMPITPSRTPSRKQKSGFVGISVGDERRIASVVGLKELESLLQGPGSDLLREILDGNC